MIERIIHLRTCRHACLLTVWLAMGSSSHAVNATWTGITNGSWATTTNWTASPVPGTGNTATLNAASANTTINTGSITINTIVFDSASVAAYTLQGGTISINDSGAITVNSTVVSSQLVSSNVLLGTNNATASYSVTNDSATNGQLLTIAGTVGSPTAAPNPGTKTLTLGGSGNGLISGIISGNGTGTGSNKIATVSISKSGAGSWELSAANTYSGATTINAGTFFANNTTGSATGTGAVNVTGGTLGGTGTITPTGLNGINVSGVLAPGGSLASGTLTFNLASTTGGVTMNGGAGLAYRLGLPGVDIDTVGASDLLALAGASAGDFSFNNNIIDFQSTGSLGFYKLFDTGSNNANTWTGLSIDGNGLITGGLGYSNLAAGYSAVLIMGGGIQGGDAGDIYLQVIPEPGAAFLGGLGTLLLVRRRRV